MTLVVLEYIKPPRPMLTLGLREARGAAEAPVPVATGSLLLSVDSQSDRTLAGCSLHKRCEIKPRDR